MPDGGCFLEYRQSAALRRNWPPETPRIWRSDGAVGVTPRFFWRSCAPGSSSWCWLMIPGRRGDAELRGTSRSGYAPLFGPWQWLPRALRLQNEAAAVCSRLATRLGFRDGTMAQGGVISSELA